MTKFEFKHLIRDIRSRRIHDYPYAKPGDTLYTPEMLVRRMICFLRGHRFFCGPPLSWKSWCRVCFRGPNGKR